jgi:HEPN domain-containing protein
MDKQQKFAYWLDIAEYDLKTADAMYDSGRYLYVAFMCQQSLEKLGKGLYNFYIDDSVPRVHNISFVLEKVTALLNVDIDESFLMLFDKLAAIYLQGRYPSFKEEVSKLIDKPEARHILDQSTEVFQWMLTLKK